MDVTDLSAAMQLSAEQAGVFLDGLGGTVAVSRLAFTPVTTVHGWRRVGMSEARFDHVRLAATARGKGEELAAAMAALADGEAV
ncbi:hypothetical protein [Sphingomonas montanisoli]|uniref:Helix-turn-helix domain-containing protein n=1 Tax=Sphingomonas montanisoli TaxID=2606412 RepID=A0A5D9C4T0_9SPHN|nr:hypothetical protein [Sphingomonas montanisoli]TZG26483.1 hypothetical protein FYJ91_16295 [Sphingomonas montanisoli]